MSTEYTLIDVAMIVVPKGAFMHSEQATRIEVQDDGGGPYIEVSQESGGIKIDPEEWPSIKRAIEQMIGTAQALEAEARG